MQETWVQSLGQEDPLKKEVATHSSILVWEILWTEELGSCSPWGHKELDTTERLHFPLLSFTSYRLPWNESDGKESACYA